MNRKPPRWTTDLAGVGRSLNLALALNPLPNRNLYLTLALFPRSAGLLVHYRGEIHV